MENFEELWDSALIGFHHPHTKLVHYEQDGDFYGPLLRLFAQEPYNPYIEGSTLYVKFERARQAYINYKDTNFKRPCKMSMFVGACYEVFKEDENNPFKKKEIIEEQTEDIIFASEEEIKETEERSDKSLVVEFYDDIKEKNKAAYNKKMNRNKIKR